jgi:hypothetical protein
MLISLSWPCIKIYARDLYGKILIPNLLEGSFLLGHQQGQPNRCCMRHRQSPLIWEITSMVIGKSALFQ